MPVTFYPEKPLNLLEDVITQKDGSPLYGEIEIYKQLYYSCQNSKTEWHIWHDLKLPFHSVNSNPLNKSEAQIDFLVLCEHGLMVIEVKGGKVFYSNRTFYSDPNLTTALPQNPIDQANGYKITLIEDAISLDKRIFISCCIAFPHSTFNVQSEIIDTNIFWSKNKFDVFDRIDDIPDLSKFLISVFKRKKNGMAIHKKHYGLLNEDQINKTIKIFNPTSIPTNLEFYSSVFEWLNVENLDLYECIRANRRIMVEGGPGTGKTTFALAFINERRDKKGLFICWNKLLKAKIKKKLYYRDLHNCDVIGFAGVNPDELEKFIAKKYDYIVIDEGQDLFDKSIDQFIEKVLDNGSGLTFGNILFLYDIDQSYSRKSTDVRDYEFLLRDYFSHFKLKANKRSAQFPDIKSLASKVITDLLSAFKCLEQENMTGVLIEYFNSKKRLLHFIRNNIYQKIKDPNDECTGMNSIILIESQVFNTYGESDGLEIDLIDFSNLSELTEENIGIEDNTLNYTTPLKYKGLESKFVFLICKEINVNNYYELYVGITRAILQVQILIIDD